MRKLTMMAVMAVALVAGCDKGDSAATAVAPAQASAPKGPTAECVICVGHEIEVTAETAKAEHDGKTYYFCSDYCKKEFVADPAKALETHAKKTAAKQASTQPTGH